ncbi:response regulator [Trinickia violacea]|uniref:Response regulator n=1 Tax=Trinickia violacea TaxID=2571746 RepID=A0A4V1EHR3_9BURK|nr:LuxR C-terminal-related transcriptional regulator [Trinickia violacea]QCP51170.1 response regulator [Trinickia violacea]
MNRFSIRVAIADDHPALQVGLQEVLRNTGEIEVVGICRNSTDLVDLLRHVACDVVISEYSIPSGKYRDGLELFGFLRRNFSEIGIVVLTTITNPAMMRTLASQDHLSVVSKADTINHIITAIYATFAGTKYNSPTIRSIASCMHASSIDVVAELSPREIEVMRLFASGNTITDIAAYLKRSKQTISSHKRSAMRKVGASNDIELLSFILNGQVGISPLDAQPEGVDSVGAILQDCDAT